MDSVVILKVLIIVMLLDEEYIHRCHELALKSYENGDLPFGALIVKDGEILAEGYNTGKEDFTGHAEVNAMRVAGEKYSGLDWSRCTLYSNFEPCAMCSFLVRDLGIGTVVYSVSSPHLGGLSRWTILSDNIRSEFTTGKAKDLPVVRGGILSEVCREPFDKLGWKMHCCD